MSINEFLYEKYLLAKIGKEFYLDRTRVVAQNLIGKSFVRLVGSELLTGIITETEAYLSEGDSASHSAVGLTNRNSAMFMDGSTIYVYKIYGIHNCINAVTESEGVGAAVLIRAIEPLFGIELMQQLRNNCNITKLCKGPGNITKAFSISLDDNKKSLLSDEIFLSNYNSVCNPSVQISQRVGISKSKELKLRFELK